MKVLFVFPNMDAGGYKPLGISILSAIAKKRGWQVALFDTSFFDVKDLSGNDVYRGNQEASEETLGVVPCDTSGFNLEEKKVDVESLFRDKLHQFVPDIVAVTLFSQEFHLGMHFLQMAKNDNPNVRTIAGGVHCIADPEGVARRPEVDLVCTGEGERTFEVFLQQMEKRYWKPVEIPTAAFQDNGKVVRTSTAPYTTLDDLPYQDNDLFDDRLFLRVFNGKVYRSLDVCLTRGCFERCIYCLFDKIYDDYGSSAVRRYSIQRFIDELEYLVERHNADFIRFQDATFCNVNSKFLEEFSRLYIERINLPFVIDTTPQQITVAKTKLLKDMGCQSMSIGIETGNEEMRRSYLQKQASNNHIRKAFACAHEVGIRTVSFILLDFPFETREHIFETIELVRECQVSAPNVGFVYPFKGSALRTMAIDQGLFDESIEPDDTALYSRGVPVIGNPNLSSEDYQGLYRTFLFYCKFPKEYWPYVRIAERFDKEGNEMYQRCLEFYDKNDLYNQYMMEPIDGVFI